MRCVVTGFVIAAVLGSAASRARAQPYAVELPESAGPEARAAQAAGADWLVFSDLSILSYTRNVQFDNAPNPANEGVPHIGIGLGAFFPEGLFGLTGPLGIRVGYTSGGPFSPGGDTLDLSTAGPSEFHNEVFELQFVGAWNEYGASPSVEISSWEFFGTTKQALEFRGATIASGERIKQTISTYGVSMPFVLWDDVNLSIFGERPVPTLIGLSAGYEFIQVGVVALTPALSGRVPNHAILGGFFVDWGIAPWLRWLFDMKFGGIIGQQKAFVVKLYQRLEFIHQPPYWADNNLELLLSIETELTDTGLGDRYLFDPTAAPEKRGGIAWTRVTFRLGLRLWF